MNTALPGSASAEGATERGPNEVAPHLRGLLQEACETPAISLDLEPIRHAIERLRGEYPHLRAAAAPPHLFGALSPTEQACAVSMTAARRQAFTSGRVAAKLALWDAGASEQIVTADEDGAPIFPRGYAGSIAHKHGRAVAIAIRPASAIGVGIDLEFDDDGAEDDLRAEVVTGAEEHQLVAVAAANPGLVSPATLVLVAKEAVYKAVFPLMREKFGFDDVEVLFDPASRAFTAVRFPGGEKLVARGRYERGGRWLLGVAAVSWRFPDV